MNVGRRVSALVLVVAVVALVSNVAAGGLARPASAADRESGANPTPPLDARRGTERVYYIAADTVHWNFAPVGKNVITNEPFGDAEDVFLKASPTRIGAVNLMSQYRPYTDASFTHLVPRRAEDTYMGILGPTIFAEVGDTITIHFKNNTPFPASVHPHGVFYGKDSEGAPYNDGTSGANKADDAVPTGGTHPYRWNVPERAGPGPMDPSSIVWMYHSHSDEVKDTNSGLVGAIVISQRGHANADGTPRGVDRNLVVDFQIFDQNQSLYLDEEIAGLQDGASIDKEDDEFIESNLKHSINGYVYGNMPLIEMKAGEHVRWYVLDLGTEVDVHSPHWHGNTVVIAGMRTDMTQLLPGGMMTADMVPDDPGIWLLHCHVNDHILAGMITRYEVTK